MTDSKRSKNLSKKRQDQLVRAAKNAAKRYARKKGEQLTEEELSGLKIQTAGPVARIIAFLLGALFIAIGLGLAIGLKTIVAIIFGVVFAIAGAVICIAAIIGHRETVDTVLQNAGEAVAQELFERMLDAIF